MSLLMFYSRVPGARVYLWTGWVSAGFNGLSRPVFVEEGGFNYGLVTAPGVLRAVGLPMLLTLSQVASLKFFVDYSGFCS